MDDTGSDDFADFHMLRCGTRHPKMKEALRVGVVTYTLDDPFINAMTDKLKENLKSMETEDMKIIVFCKKWQG